MYLLIQNKGEAPIEGYTLLGMSTARNCGVDGVIGKFGSGTKHAINILLRKGIEFHIYAGKTRLEFFYRIETINDGLGETETARVYCRLSGDVNRTIDCGWCLDFGAMDWRETHMGLREFVSNAIDRTIRETGGFKAALKSKDLRVDVEPNRRARAGYTRIFVSLHGEGVREFYEHRGVYFLHLSRPELVCKRYIPKPSGTPPSVYRQGVFVRELRGLPSVYDYNFADSEIDIDECRNSSEYGVRAAIANSINQADADTLSELFHRMSQEDVYESSLDTYYLGYHESEEVKAAWQKGWEAFAGNAVASTASQEAVVEYAQKKGHRTVQVKSEAFVRTAEKMGIKSVVSVLGEKASEGKVPVPATEEAIAAVDRVWLWLERLSMTNGKSRPGVHCFRDLMNAGSETFGYYENGAVYIREDQGGKYLLKVALEECVHYVTGATDNSRDFQNFLIDMAVELAAA